MDAICACLAEMRIADNSQIALDEFKYLLPKELPMIKVLTGSVALLPAVAFASPFIISEPYPYTMTQPTSCIAVDGNTVYESPVEVVEGGLRCKIDIQGAAEGQHTMQVRAKRVTETGVVESTSVPFSFNMILINPPAGLQLIQ